MEKNEQFSGQNNTEQIMAGQNISEQRSSQSRENDPADHLRFRGLDLHTGLCSDPGRPAHR